MPSLDLLAPELQESWSYAANADLKFRNDIVTPGSNAKAWWRCPTCVYEWQTRVSHRSNGSGCPACSGKVVVLGKNDLATVAPHLVDDWHPTKNQEQTPETVSAGSSHKAWWLGACGHEWPASVKLRVYGRGCPVCTGRTVLSGVNDLATVAPDLAAEWHPTLNGELLPSEVLAGTHTSYWWLGKCGHEWSASASNRNHATKPTACSVCASKKPHPGYNDALSFLPPSVIQEYAQDLNSLPLSAYTLGSSKKKAWWRCLTSGHTWKSNIYHRSIGKGCPRCSRRISKAEQEIGAWLEHLSLKPVYSARGVVTKELDLYLPQQKFAIEYNGLYWHSEEQGKDSSYHQTKWLEAKAAGIQLVQIWEDEWNRNPEQVKRMLAHKLGVQLPGERRVMARKARVEEVVKQQAEEFLNEHHIQGYANGSHYLGLYDQENTLVAVLVLKKEAGTDGKTLNIIRYATAATVPGGFTKLLKHAERTYEPEAFITFSDNCVSDGGLYRNNGFVADKELPPDYMYIVRGERKHKFGYRLKRFRDDPALQYEDGLTEKELARLNGLPRIWDAGKTRWRRTVQQGSERR